MSATRSPTPTSPAGDDGGGGESGGGGIDLVPAAVAGGVIAAVLIVGLGVFLWIVARRERRARETALWTQRVVFARAGPSALALTTVAASPRGARPASLARSPASASDATLLRPASTVLRLPTVPEAATRAPSAQAPSSRRSFVLSPALAPRVVGAHVTPVTTGALPPRADGRGPPP